MVYTRRVLLCKNTCPTWLLFTEGSKSNIPCCARTTCACNICMIRGLTHIVRKFCAYHLRDILLWCARFTPDARHIRESDANVACTCRSFEATYYPQVGLDEARRNKIIYLPNVDNRLTRVIVSISLARLTWSVPLGRQTRWWLTQTFGLPGHVQTRPNEVRKWCR
jgi:hypothetical protein